MALTTTTLAEAWAANHLTLNATAATGASVGGFVKVDQEYAVITEIIGTAITVRSRGAFGSAAKAHAKLAPCTFGLFTDLPAAVPGRSAVGAARDVVSYQADGAIAVPTRDTFVLFTGAAQIDMTIADPGAANDGVMVTFVNTTAVANTVTFTTGLYGSADESVATFPSALGASLTVMAYKGVWAYVMQSMAANPTAGNVGLAAP